ncbi:MAG: CBS domain-containing protein [Desulfobacterales bacterium]|nr:CBS domain-containing protein [Desulfobacterales bacterium]
MKTISLTDLVVPLSEYATIPLGASLLEAVEALESAQEEFDATKYRHRAILVLDETGHVIGKIGQLDALRALEPKYCEMVEGNAATRLGFSAKFLKSMCEQYDLFNKPMDDLCKKAATLKAEDCMDELHENEYIDINATLDMAIHQLVMGHHQSLIVRDGDSIVGILRLTDVFVAVFHAMKECSI